MWNIKIKIEEGNFYFVYIKMYLVVFLMYQVFAEGRPVNFLFNLSWIDVAFFEEIEIYWPTMPYVQGNGSASDKIKFPFEFFYKG